MTNRRICCCGDDCTSDYRVFKPCPTTVGGLPFRNVVMSLEQLKYCGIVAADDVVYIYTPPDDDCDEYCGTWVCDNDYDPDDETHQCTNIPLDECGDCNLAGTDPDLSKPYRAVRPAELDLFCAAFELLTDLNDLEDGSCCDVRCKNRSLSQCEDGDVTNCQLGDSPRACECMSLAGTSYTPTWSVNLYFDAADAIYGRRDYFYGDCQNPDFEFDELFDTGWGLTTLGSVVNIIQVDYCPTPNGSRPWRYQLEVLTIWNASVGSFSYPSNWCPAGINGADIWKCEINQNNRVSSWNYSDTFITQHFCSVQVANTTTPSIPSNHYVSLCHTASALITNETNTSGTNGQSSHPCFLQIGASAIPNVWKWAQSLGFPSLASAPDYQLGIWGVTENNPVIPRGLCIELCDDMRGTSRWDGNKAVTARIPYVFDDVFFGLYNTDNPDGWGKITIDYALNTPAVPDSPASC